MSTNSACFLVGLVAAIFWFVGFTRGVMLGRSGVGVKPQMLVHKESSPVSFWIAAIGFGCVTTALIVLPILSWSGV